MGRIAIIYIAMGGLVAVGAGLWWALGPGGASFADADDAALVARGQGVYAAHCASCHGENLEGQPSWRERKADGRLPAPPHDETGHTWHHTDAQLFQVTKHGSASIGGPDYKTDMIGFGELLSDDDIWAVLAYIKSRWPEAVRRRSAAVNWDKR